MTAFRPSGFFGSDRGGSELVLVLIMAVLGASVGAYFLSQDPFKAAILAETRHDLDSVRDNIVLALSDEQECRQAFTSAPMNAFDYSEGDSGTEAMDMVALSVRGVTIANVGQDLVGGKVTKVWLENSKAGPPLSGLRHFEAILKVQADSFAINNPISAKVPLNLLVDAANKVQYCYLTDSVAVRTCENAGGVFDPTALPTCRFNFTNTTCATARTCVTGLDSLGNIQCSGVMTTPPPPPPPPSQCFCDGSCFPTNWMDGQPCRGVHWVNNMNEWYTPAQVASFSPHFQCDALGGPFTDDQCLTGSPPPHCGDYYCRYRADFSMRCVNLPIPTKPGGCP